MTDPVRLRGISASIGVAVGPANFLAAGFRAPRQRRLTEDAILREVDRFERAVEASKAEIERAKRALTDRHGNSYGPILDVYLLMHDDALLIDATSALIRKEKINAEWALDRVVDELKAPLLEDSSSYFRERARDIDHVREHLVRELTGETAAPVVHDAPSILVAHDLTPADAVHWLAPPTLGLVTEMGGSTSHTAILARTYGIPAVAGVGPLPMSIEQGETLVVDAFSGEVTVGASEQERKRAEGRRDRFVAFLRSERAAKAQTKDGVAIAVGANIELPNEIEAAIQQGAEGVGLYRTEFMCLDRQTPPTEAEQVDVYRRVASAVAPGRVVFRTFDWRDDKRLHTNLLEVHERDWLRTQVRALLQAQDAGTMSLMFPMVGHLYELEQGRTLVRECASELGVGEPPIGMMVEVPSAALGALRFAEQADFFAIGTNDLVQYTLGLDRRDYRTAQLASPLHPAVLDLIDKTVHAARTENIPCSMCGNMAADPIGLAIALGLGLRDVSVPVAVIPLARAVVRAIDLPVAEATAREAMQCQTVAEVRALALARFGEELETLWRDPGP